MRDLAEQYSDITAALREALGEVGTEQFYVHGIYADDDNVSDISAKSFDGFIAHTNGGLLLRVPCSLDSIDSEGTAGKFEEETLRGYIERAYVDAAKYFIDARDHIAEAYQDYDESGGDLYPDAWLYEYFEERECAYNDRYHNSGAPELAGIEPAPAWDLTADAQEREEWYEYATEYLQEGGTFFYQIGCIFYAADNRRNVTGADELYIYYGINTDFEYGRDSGVVTCGELTVKVSRLTAARVRTIIQGAADRVTS